MIRPLDPSIAPHWNWKRQKVRPCTTRADLQSHLTGIENWNYSEALFNKASTFNRTSLELKIWNKVFGFVWAGSLQSHLTGIEKDCTQSVWIRCCPLQSHLTGIENPQNLACSCHLLSFNRTSLELKIGLQNQCRWSLGTFNRTSLELKKLGAGPSFTGLRPSIAPHWNWKLVSTCIRLDGLSAFNRTSLELKIGRTDSGAEVWETFNRTSLELKIRTPMD